MTPTPQTVTIRPGTILSAHEAPAIPPGYKQTEVGVIPEDWEVRPLKEISPSQSVGLVINPSSYFDERGTVPMLVGSNITANRIHWQSAQRISDTNNMAIAASRLATQDLITVRVGEPGVTAVVPPELDGCNCASVMIVRQHETFDSHWLCYVMNSKIGLEQVKHVQYGTAQKQFNISDAVNFLFPVPTLPEQKVIAEALSDVDQLLGSLEKLIAKKRAIKQAAMQQLLTGKTRLPGFSEKWETRRLGELGYCLRGVSYDPMTDLWSYDTENTVRLLRSNNVQDATVTTTDLQFVESSRVSEFQIMEPDDVLVCMANGSKELVGKAGLFRIVDGYAYTFGAFMGCFRTERTTTEPGFIFQLFQTERFHNFIGMILAGSSINNLKPSDIESAGFRMPDRNEQAAISAVLSDMDAEITTLERRRDKTRAIKQGMMQQLLTGRLRLIKPPSTTEASK